MAGEPFPGHGPRTPLALSREPVVTGPRLGQDRRDLNAQTGGGTEEKAVRPSEVEHRDCPLTGSGTDLLHHQQIRRKSPQEAP